MEVTLFSGFELNSIPPLLLNPQVTNMLHGFYDNNLWFIFANVTRNCLVCVQYSIRSGFIVASIRPAYARIYPVGREDLGADTFFHTPAGSSLLRDITEDDLFTWFRHNGSGLIKEQENVETSTVKAEITVRSAEKTISTTTKHVNTKKQEIPSKYLKNDEVKDEEIAATFAPEIKNDRYLLLDKEQLWGMLKEVINDEINKKIKHS